MFINADTVTILFDVPNETFEMQIDLSWSPSQGDLDLFIEAADGVTVGSGTNGLGASESVNIKNRIICEHGTGSWTMTIDPWLTGPTTYNWAVYFTLQTGGACGTSSGGNETAEDSW